VPIRQVVLQLVGRGEPLAGPPLAPVGDDVVAAVDPDQGAGQSGEVTVMPCESKSLQDLCWVWAETWTVGIQVAALLKNLPSKGLRVSPSGNITTTGSPIPRGEFDLG